MTEETEDGDSSSPEPDPTDKPPPAAKSWPAIALCLPVTEAAMPRAPLTEAIELPLDPGLCLAIGIGFAFVGGLLENALQKFSPALLLMRVEKQGGDPDASDLEDLEKELQEGEVYLPTTVLLKFAGLCLGLIAGLALLDGASLWPAGWTGMALVFVLAVLFGGVLPDRITDLRAERIVYRTLPVLRVLRILFLPLTVPVSKLASLLVRNVLGIREELEQANDREKLADEIRAAVEDSDEEEELADEEKEWIENIVEFRKEDAAGIMTPRTDMVCIESSHTFREAVETAVQAGHSRLPVFTKKMDDIVGIFYLRDAVGLLAENAADLLDKPVSGYMREAYFVPESKRVSDLLHEFKARRVQIAIVVDEYGGTAGLVSIEDIIEEIVGEIEDEYDPEREDPLLVLENGKLAEVDAKVRIGDLNEAMSIDVPDSEDYETIGGFVFSHLGRIPRTGESFHYENLEMTVLAAGPRKVSRLSIRVNAQKARA